MRIYISRWYGCNHNSLDTWPPLEVISLDNLQQGFTAGTKCFRRWQGHTRTHTFTRLAALSMPWEGTGRTGTWRRRTRSFGRLGCDTCYRPWCSDWTAA